MNELECFEDLNYPVKNGAFLEPGGFFVINDR